MAVLPVTDPVLIFAITMGIIFLAPLVVRRLHVPGLVGLILSGAVVGPSMLGLLERDATFQLLGTVGLLYLMFMAGVSIDLTQFARLKMRSVTFGTLSFLFPQLAALIVAILLLGWSIPTALLLGSIVGSHTLLAYPIADRLGVTKGKATIMAMGATMVTDILSLVILAIVVAMVSGDSSPAFWLRFVTFVGIWAAAVIYVLPRMGRWFLRNFRHGSVADYGFLMSMLFVTAWLAGIVGLAPIIGAFLAGLMMNRLVPVQSPLMSRIKFVGEALFIPFFLVSVGMLVDVGVLTESFEVWGLAILFTSLVVFGKTAAAKLAQVLYGHSSQEGWLIAGLTIPQAAATLAVTLVGFEIGLFSELAVNAVVVMILLTSIIGPYLVERFGRAVALEEQARPLDPAEAPQRILAPLANPESAEALLDLAILLHSPTSDEPIYPMTIVRDGHNNQAAVAQAEALLETAVIHAGAADVRCTPLTRIDYDVAGAITRAAKEQRISTIVIGWSGQSGARQRIFGTVLDSLLDQTREMLIVAKAPQPMTAPHRMLVGMPPLIERELGFPAAARALKIFAAQRKIEMVVFALRSVTDDLQALLDRTRPPARVTVTPLEAWSEFVPALDQHVTPNDVLVMLSVRQGALSWRPSLNRLPSTLADRFADNDLLTVYLSEQDLASLMVDQNGSDAFAPGEMLISEHIVMDLPEDPAEAVEKVLASAVSEEDAAMLTSRFIARADRARDTLPEIKPGVVFYHAHADVVTRPTVLVGLRSGGLKLPDTGQPAQVVLIFLAPSDISSSTYLKRLAVVAKLFGESEVTERLLHADSPDEVRRILLENLRHTAEVAVMA
ncbi:cation:proton antiporter [soil metagenome]